MGKKRMTATQAFKKRFVERRLAPMLADAADGFVAGCEYRARGDEETLIVRLSRPGGLASAAQLMAPDELAVNVSGDGKWTILKDVTEAVAKLYER